MDIPWSETHISSHTFKKDRCSYRAEFTIKKLYPGHSKNFELTATLFAVVPFQKILVEKTSKVDLKQVLKREAGQLLKRWQGD